MDISRSIKQGLSARLSAAEALLNDDNPSNDKAICGKLQAFMSQVNAKAGKGLSHEQAKNLLAVANAIKENLGTNRS